MQLHPEFRSLLRVRQTVAAIIAAGILVAIFIPFQKVEALSIASGIPIPSSVLKTGPDQTFTMVITLAPGEILTSSTTMGVTFTPGTPSPSSQSGTISLSPPPGFTPTPGTGTPDSLLTAISVSPSPVPITGGPYYYVIASGWVGPGTVTVTATLKPTFLTTGNTPTTQTFLATVGGASFSQSFTVIPPATPSGGGGGGGTLVNIDLTTQPASYFAQNPLQRFIVSSTALVNAQGSAITRASVGEPVAVSTSFRNNQQVAQEYAFIVQITDQNGFTVEVTSLSAALESGNSVQLSKSWTPQEPGRYTVKVLLWNSVTGIPVPLTSDTVRVITVQ